MPVPDRRYPQVHVARVNEWLYTVHPRHIRILVPTACPIVHYDDILPLEERLVLLESGQACAEILRPPRADDDAEVHRRLAFAGRIFRMFHQTPIANPIGMSAIGTHHQGEVSRIGTEEVTATMTEQMIGRTGSKAWTGPFRAFDMSPLCLSIRKTTIVMVCAQQLRGYRVRRVLGTLRT